MSTLDDGNSPNPEKRLFVVGGETKSTDAAEGKNAIAPDGAARGIFSRVVLKTESQSDYDSLVTGLRNACQPNGTLEEILVEKLASVLWRYRRLITAESDRIGEALRSGESGKMVISAIYHLNILSMPRYEASLERAFDRTLAQLERLQGIRLGRPVTRPLNFGITA